MFLPRFMISIFTNITISEHRRFIHDLIVVSSSPAPSTHETLGYTTRLDSPYTPRKRKPVDGVLVHRLIYASLCRSSLLLLRSVVLCATPLTHAMNRNDFTTLRRMLFMERISAARKAFDAWMEAWVEEVRSRRIGQIDDVILNARCGVASSGC